MKRTISVMLAAVILCISLCSCSLFGAKLDKIVLSETSLELEIGNSVALSASAQPENAKLGTLTWSSSDTNIVTVNNSTVMAVKAGKAVVTVENEDGIKAQCNVTVNEITITAITLSSTATKLDKGDTIQLIANITPAAANPDTLTWSSSNEKIAVVNSDGYVTGVKAGVVSIVCKASDTVQASCTVTVEDKQKATTSANNAGTTVNNYYGHYHPAYTYSASDFVFPNSSSQQLTRDEITSTLYYMSGYSPAGNYAQDAINEIYARNGYVFQTASIRSYYESKPWYYADPTFSINDFNSIEKYNIALLNEYA